MQRVFVGDVQGCADENDELVERVRAHFGGDFELCWVGDLVNRGPYNLRVLRRVRELADSGRGRVVLGNHDLELLRIAAGLSRPGPRDTLGEVLAAPDRDDWIDWLRRLPVVESGWLGRERFVMVHASAPPGMALTELERRAREVEGRLAEGSLSDLAHFLGGPPEPGSALELLDRLTQCRSVSNTGEWRREPPGLAAEGFQAWHALWSRHEPDYGVVYGHWSLQGLHVAPGLRGLDTGCVHHGRGRDGALTAWLPEGERPFRAHENRFWSVPARRIYYPPAG